MNKILITLGLSLLSTISMAGINISAYQFSDVAKIEVTHAEAKDLYSALRVEETPKFKCIRSDGGRTNRAPHCFEYAKDPYKFEKSIPGVFCTKILQPLSINCQLSGDSFSQLVNGTEVLLSNSRGENISNTAAPYFEHLPQSTFQTANGTFVLRCETLIQGRYYDCFIGINKVSPNVTITLNQKLSIKGNRLLNGEFRRQYYKLGQGVREFDLAQELRSEISHPVESILSERPQHLSLTIAQRNTDDSFIHPIVYNLTGRLLKVEKRTSRFDNTRRETVVIFELDRAFLNKLRASLPLTLENIERVNNLLGESDRLNYKSILKLDIVNNKLQATTEFILN